MIKLNASLCILSLGALHKEMSVAAPSDHRNDYQLVMTLQDCLMCNICYSYSTETYLSGCCQNTLCKSCLETTMKATTIAEACPICHNQEFTILINNEVHHTLCVFCVNKEKGCEQKREVNDIISHLGNSNGCQFEDVTCSSDCGKCLQRQYFAGHVEDECTCRKVDCQYCQITGEHQFIEGEHKEQCPKFPIACPNKCEVGSVPRDDVEEHMKMCPLELIQCEYHMVGCEERMARKDQKKHIKEKMEEHLSFMKQGLNVTREHLKVVETATKDSKCSFSEQLEKMQANHSEQLLSISTKLAVLEDNLTAVQRKTNEVQEQFGFRLASFANEISAVNEFFNNVKSQAQQTTDELNQKITIAQVDTKITTDNLVRRITHSEHTFKQELEVTQNEVATITQNLSAAQTDAERTKEDARKEINEIAQKLKNTKQDLNTTKEQLTTTCQNLAKAKTKHITLTAKIDEALAKVETRFQTNITRAEHATQTSITELETKLHKRIQQTEQKFYWYRTITLTGSKLSSGDQVIPVIVKMSDYTNKKLHKEIWYSDSFYTHYKGYKMCLCVYSAGLIAGKKSHLSVKLYVMKGPYDDQLAWPFEGYCKVKLLNQISDTEHHLGLTESY